jgi:hypothetical protein
MTWPVAFILAVMFPFPSSAKSTLFCQWINAPDPAVGCVVEVDLRPTPIVLSGWETWKRLGMPELLSTLGFNRSQSQAAAISVINRLADPTSEHSLLDWYRRTGLPELMGNALRGAGDDRFYRASDLLLARQGDIERHLRERQSSLFNLERTVLLYDLTNTHHKEERVDAHVFICVLAYHLLRNILWTLEQKGDHRNGETLKRVLRTHCYTTILLPTRNGPTHRIRKAGQPEECQKTIYRNLGIDWGGLPCHRSVIGAAPVQKENHARHATL